MTFPISNISHIKYRFLGLPLSHWAIGPWQVRPRGLLWRVGLAEQRPARCQHHLCLCELPMPGAVAAHLRSPLGALGGGVRGPWGGSRLLRRYLGDLEKHIETKGKRKSSWMIYFLKIYLNLFLSICIYFFGFRRLQNKGFNGIEPMILCWGKVVS